MTDAPDTTTARGRLWRAIWDGFTPEARDAYLRDYRAQVLAEARVRLHTAAAAQRSNTSRRTHYSEAADIVHRMIVEQP